MVVLRKLKNILPFNIRKTLVKVLVLSKLYFSGMAYHNLSDCLANRSQRVQKTSTSFVLRTLASTLVSSNGYQSRNNFNERQHIKQYTAESGQAISK